MGDQKIQLNEGRCYSCPGRKGVKDNMFLDVAGESKVALTRAYEGYWFVHDLSNKQHLHALCTIPIFSSLISSGDNLQLSKQS